MIIRSAKKCAMLAVLAGCLALMTGCGGGGSNNSSSTQTFKLYLAAANVPTGVQLGTIKTSITLPAGVSIPADNTGLVDASSIVATGTTVSGTSQVLGNYQASARTLVIGLVNTTGFGNGDYLVVTFDVNNGTTVTAADFSVTVTEAKDNGPTYGQVSGVTVAAR
ncbi:hypothetical protein OR1_01640 [Geobacter sp. OR-1]|uniref:hypothetical protein n=1 Tax=Geobacter sp. OR-1 TaxID=1266765 RepID=UPI0005424B09|nr:hypothetical protein [Geobacter sp. OR-1]GAM09363.1 hypothetical protein OR1_01640 [Geobacter sp. OR-1]